MKKTYQGSCHCGAVRFACDLDLSAGTTRCNCTSCFKSRFWMAFVKVGELRVLQGGEALTQYQYTPEGRPAPFLEFNFCGRCSVRTFTHGGALPRFDGEFYAVNVACLDDATEAELAAAPVHFANGRHNHWDETPANHAYL